MWNTTHPRNTTGASAAFSRRFFAFMAVQRFGSRFFVKTERGIAHSEAGGRPPAYLRLRRDERGSGSGRVRGRTSGLGAVGRGAAGVRTEPSPGGGAGGSAVSSEPGPGTWRRGPGGRSGIGPARGGGGPRRRRRRRRGRSAMEQQAAPPAPPGAAAGGRGRDAEPPRVSGGGAALGAGGRFPPARPPGGVGRSCGARRAASPGRIPRGGGRSEGPAEVRSGAGRGGRAEGTRLRDGGASGTAAVLSRAARQFFPGLCERLRAAPLPAPSLPAARLRSEGAGSGACAFTHVRTVISPCVFAYSLLERGSVWRRARLSP